MRAIACAAVLLWGVLAGSPGVGAVYFSESFDKFADDAAVKAAGWSAVNTATAVERGATWTIANPGKRQNPPTIDGKPTSGKFMISDSDIAPEEANPLDTGASHDLVTPKFATRGGARLWLHVDVNALANNNYGTGVFDIEVTTDGGATWSNAWRRIQPGRALGKGPSSPAAKSLPPTNANCDGYHGRLDVDLSSLARNAAAVQLRFRHYEPNDDWWFAIDNIVVDDVPPPGPGSQAVFSEDFSAGLGKMSVKGVLPPDKSWSTNCPAALYTPGKVKDEVINRLGHPDATPHFAIIATREAAVTADEYLMTPILDLSQLTEVFLAYQDENRPSENNDTQRVLLMRDSNGNRVAESTDEVIKVVYNYNAGAIGKGNEDPWYAARRFFVPEAARRNDVFFAWNYQIQAKPGNWWAIDQIEVTGNSTPVGPPPGSVASDPAADLDSRRSSLGFLLGVVVIGLCFLLIGIASWSGFKKPATASRPRRRK
jgi:hypothetical protein